MRFLERERTVLEAMLPGLDSSLADVTLKDLEDADGPAIGIFRRASGPGLLVPVALGGSGAGPAEALAVQRAIGSRAPSLAVATTMHHFSVAGLLEVARAGIGFEPALLRDIAQSRKLLASAFAEGIHDAGVFAPTMRARREGPHLVVNGVKKPCSLSRSMDLLTASVLVEPEAGAAAEFAVVIVPADAPGVAVTPFWGTGVLRGTQSDAVVLTDVVVDPGQIIGSGPGEQSEFAGGRIPSCVWFELLITAAYLGVASALVERMLLEVTGDPGMQARAVADLEAAMAALDGVARRAAAGDHDLLAPTLACRYATQDAVDRAVAIAVEHLGGMAFVGSDEISYLASASRALAFHPPGRNRTAGALLDAYRGEEFRPS